MNPYSINVRLQARQFQTGEKPRLVQPGELIRELSSSQSDWYKTLSAYGQNPDPIVRKKGLKIYQEMLQDDQVKACIELRKKARLSVPSNILSADENNPEANKYADFVKHVLDRLEGPFENDLYEIYSAIEFGFSLSELNFMILPDGPFAGKLGLRSIKTREPFDYDFKVDAHGNLLGIVYSGPGSPWPLKGVEAKTASLGTQENPYPLDKFIVYSYNMQFSNWYGRSDLLAAFNSWIAKKHILKFWNIFLERYASPLAWITLDPAVALKKQVVDEVDDFLKNLSARSGFRAPKGVELTPVTFSSTAGAEYEKSVEAHNRFIAHALLCPNLLGYTQQQTQGSYALGRKHFDAFLWVLESLGRDTAEDIVGDQIIKRLINLNFPGVDQDLLPRFKFEGIEEESIEARARIVSMLAQNGFMDINESWVREFLSLPKRERTLDVSDDDFIPMPRLDVTGAGEETEQNGEEQETTEETKQFAEDDLVAGPGGKEGVWRTINGRKIFIPVGEGKSIGDSIRERLGQNKAGFEPDDKSKPDSNKSAKKRLSNLIGRINSEEINQENLSNEVKNMSSRERLVLDTINRYTREDFVEIRKMSVNIESGGEIKEIKTIAGRTINPEAVRDLNGMVRNAPLIPKNRNIFRATNAKSGFSLKIGDTFDTKGISSFTENFKASTTFFDESEAKQIVYRITKGNALNISSISHYRDESELLVLGKFRVTKIEKDYQAFNEKFDLYDLEQSNE